MNRPKGSIINIVDQYRLLQGHLQCDERAAAMLVLAAEIQDASKRIACGAALAKDQAAGPWLFRQLEDMWKKCF